MANIQEIIAGVGHETHNRFTFDASSVVGSYTLFTVTGTVSLRIIATGEVLLVSAGGGTIEVGTATNTAAIIAQTTASNLAANEIWHDNSPDATVEAEATTVSQTFRVTEDVKLKIATATVTAGRIAFTCIWKPLSKDAFVTTTNLGGSASPSRSPSASTSPSASISPSASLSPSSSVSSSPSASVSPSSSLSPSSSVSSSPSASRSPSSSVSSSPSASVSPSSSASASVSPSGSTSPSSSISPSSSVSSSPSSSSSPSPSL